MSNQSGAKKSGSHPAWHLMSGVTFMEFTFLTGVASLTSYTIFTEAKDHTFLKTMWLPPSEELVSGPTGMYILYAIPLGIACGVFGLVGIALIGLGQESGIRLYGLIDKMGVAANRPRLGSRSCAHTYIHVHSYIALLFYTRHDVARHT